MKPSYTDLILTNKPRSFQTKCVTETGLLHFHRMTTYVLKMHFRKTHPKVISQRDFHMYSLRSALYDQNNENKVEEPDTIFQVFQDVLNTHEPRKKKMYMLDNKSFMIKSLSKSILQGTPFRKKI